MTDSLSVLIIDDSEDDARLITNELQRGGFDLLFERVNSTEAIKAALEKKTWDVVISNFVVSQCTALEVLALLQEKNLDLPFIIVSDTMSEDIALRAMKTGVHSFFKKKNIRLLVPAVERGLRETAIKRARQQAEEALISSNQELNDIIEFLPDATFVLDNDKKVIAWNRAIEEMTGIKKQAIIGQGDNAVTIPFYGERRPHLLDLIDVSDKKLESKYQYVQKKGNTLYAEAFTPALYGGKGAYVWGTGAPLFDTRGNRVGAIESIRDITEYKQAEQKLQASEENYREIFNASNDALFIHDLKTGDILDVNQKACEMYKCSREDFIDSIAVVGCLSFGEPPYTEQEALQWIHKASSECPQTFEWRGRDRENRIFWAEVNLKRCVIRGCDRILAVVREITERKQAEEALRENEKKYRSLYQEFQGILDAIPDSLSLISPNLKIVWANKGLAMLLHKNLPDLLGQYCYQVWHGGSEPCEICPAQRCFRSKKPEFDEVTTPDGGVWDVRDVPIFGDQGEVKGVIDVARNVTEKKKAFQELLSLNEQLRQSQKMEAIGRLAGGVAHDFNNLLTVIQVNSELALHELAHDDSLKLKIDEIKTAAERAANLTRQLLAFSRRQVFNLKVINLNFILEDLEKMLYRIIGEEIELITSFADDLGRVKADPGEIEQVIINFAVNAKDAMPHGGTLTIATANVELDEEYVRRHPGTLPGSYIVISVTDTGVGMPKEIHEQIFDPFFTTKEESKGTGLGLSTVYGIVKQSGGDIQVYSELGQGTTFKVYFPRVDEPLEVIEKGKGAEEALRGNETILVVEDDTSVRKIAVQVLTNQGYNVLVAESGGDALLICEQEKHPIHLVLTDVVMPKMSGPELIERLKKVRIDFTVLYMSGYTDKHILKGLKDELNFIQKPFTVDVLAKKVRDVLDTKKGSKKK